MLILRRTMGESSAIVGSFAGLAYVEGARQERLPANLIQAQRDVFGAHTYERRDRAGPMNGASELARQTTEPASSRPHTGVTFNATSNPT
jgi:6-phosphogluconate dehydrogenase